MSEVQVVYNPTAGNGEHSLNKIIELLKNVGKNVNYSSTADENWEASLIEKPQIIYAAGGDGTIQKVTEALLKRKTIDRKVPIQILPLGTANNIAKTLGIDNCSIPEIINGKSKIKKYDCGKITGLADKRFFIESFGLGIFPNLILEMKKDETKRTPSEKLKYTYTILKQLIETYQPKETTLEINGLLIKGYFLMAEVMNIKYLGPNLNLAPNANPGDSFFDLVLIREHSREIFSKYIDSLIKRREKPDLMEFTETHRVKKLTFTNVSPNLHVDDEVIQNPANGKIVVENKPGIFKMRSPF